MSTVANIIRSNHEQIVERWRQQAAQSASARGLTTLEFENIIPHFLSALADASGDLGQLNNNRRMLVENHLSSRLRQGFDLAEIVEEFAILARVVSQMWQEGGQ